MSKDSCACTPWPLRDSTACGELLRRWDNYICRVAHRFALSTGIDADDLAQEARIKILLLERRSGAVPEPYVRTTIANAMKRLVSKERQSPTLLSPQVDAIDSTNLRDVAHPFVAETPSEMSMWARSLPGRLGDIYLLIYEQDMTQRQAAAVLQVSQPRVFQIHCEFLRLAHTEFQIAA